MFINHIHKKALSFKLVIYLLDALQQNEALGSLVKKLKRSQLEFITRWFQFFLLDNLQL